MSRGYEPGPREAILRLFEESEDYLRRQGCAQFRETVSEYRRELGSRLIDESFERYADSSPKEGENVE